MFLTPRLAAVTAVAFALTIGTALAQPAPGPLDTFALVIAGLYDGAQVQHQGIDKPAAITAKGNGVFEYIAESGGMQGTMQIIFESPTECVFVQKLVAPAGVGIPIKFDLNRWSGLHLTPLQSEQIKPGFNGFLIEWTGPEDAYQGEMAEGQWSYMGMNAAAFAGSVTPEQLEQALDLLKSYCPMNG